MWRSKKGRLLREAKTRFPQNWSSFSKTVRETAKDCLLFRFMKTISLLSMSSSGGSFQLILKQQHSLRLRFWHEFHFHQPPFSPVQRYVSHTRTGRTGWESVWLCFWRKKRDLIISCISRTGESVPAAATYRVSVHAIISPLDSWQHASLRFLLILMVINYSLQQLR